MNKKILFIVIATGIILLLDAIGYFTLSCMPDTQNTSATTSPTVAPSLHTEVLSISANPQTVSSPTFEDQIAAWNLAYDAGARGQTLLYTWSQLEPKKEVYDTSELSRSIDNLGKRFVLHLNIAVLNTTTKETPSDLKVVPFKSSQMRERFKSLIDAVVPIIGSVTYLAIGNEVDVYLSSHPDEWDAYREFYEDAAEYVRAKLPGVKVGVTVTYDGATGSNADKILALNKKSDIGAFTYYPLDANFYPLGSEAVSIALPKMVEIAGGQPVVIQEMGYSSSSLLKSSEKEQASFVTNALKTWVRVGKRISFIDFWLMHELTQDQVNELAAYYGMPQNEELKACLGSVGLRRSDGTPKPAWQALIEGGRAVGLPVYNGASDK